MAPQPTTHVDWAYVLWYLGKVHLYLNCGVMSFHHLKAPPRPTGQGFLMNLAIVFPILYFLQTGLRFVFPTSVHATLIKGQHATFDKGGHNIEVTEWYRIRSCITPRYLPIIPMTTPDLPATLYWIFSVNIGLQTFSWFLPFPQKSEKKKRWKREKIKKKKKAKWKWSLCSLWLLSLVCEVRKVWWCDGN